MSVELHGADQVLNVTLSKGSVEQLWGGKSCRLFLWTACLGKHLDIFCCSLHTNLWMPEITLKTLSWLPKGTVLPIKLFYLWAVINVYPEENILESLERKYSTVIHVLVVPTWEAGNKEKILLILWFLILFFCLPLIWQWMRWENIHAVLFTGE